MKISLNLKQLNIRNGGFTDRDICGNTNIVNVSMNKPPPPPLKVVSKGNRSPGINCEIIKL